MTTDSISAAQIPSIRQSAESATEGRILVLFAIYHLVLGTALLVLQQSESRLLFGSRYPDLFSIVAWSFVALAPVALFFALRSRPAFPIQIQGLLVFDILTLTLLMHASGGIGSGIGVLMAVSLAIASLATHGRTPFLFAGLASIAVLVQQIPYHLAGTAQTSGIIRAGLLSLAFFAIAFLAYASWSRLRQSEQKIEKQAVDLADLDAINALVIDLLDIGVIAVDQAGGIRTANDTATSWLKGSIDNPDQNRLTRLPAKMLERFLLWQETTYDDMANTYHTDARELEITLKALPGNPGRGALILLRDMERVRDEHHQTKLAAIGRMAASIAHEIRNPLSSISQAAQLLQEKKIDTASTNTIADIVLRNSRRLDRTVENILSVARKRSPVRDQLNLCEVVSDFVDQNSALTSMGDVTLSASCRGQPNALFDRAHLDEVLQILFDNAARHAAPKERLEIRLIATTGEDDTPLIEVQDNGRGVSPEAISRLFEPFFSTTDDTGLGLFLAKQLCALNGACLELQQGGTAGAKFTILMMAPANAVTQTSDIQVTM